MSCGFCFSLGLHCRGQVGMGSGVKGCWFYEEEKKPMDITKLYRMGRREFSDALDALSLELLKELGRLWKADLEGCANKEEIVSTIYHRRSEMQSQQRLVKRLCHYKKLVELNAPDFLYERARNLVARSLLEVTPRDFIETLEQFPMLYREFDETHKETMAEAEAALEAEFAKEDELSKED